MSGTESTSLSADERGALLALARAAIGERIFGDGRLAAALEALPRTPALCRPAALFVSLKTRGAEEGRNLRGCIGILQPAVPLFEEVVATAPRAAFEDPRFAPLEASELGRVKIELSVLGPLVALSDPREIVLGRDGVQLVRGSCRAVFLPQVAREQGWDRERLLAQLSLKAGLDDRAWRSAELYVFGAERFAEDDQAPGGKNTSRY